jgi:hypothetical protein
MFLPKPHGNGNDDISSGEYFENIKKQERELFTTRSVHFFQFF